MPTTMAPPVSTTPWHDRKILIEDRRLRHTAEARPGKDRLDQDRPRQEDRDIHAAEAQYRQETVAQRMAQITRRSESP